MSADEPNQYTAAEIAKISLLLGGTLARGKVSPRTARALDKVKAKAIEREAIEQAAALQARAAKIQAKIDAKAARKAKGWW